MNKTGGLFALLLLVSTIGWAQENYWVLLRDKPHLDKSYPALGPAAWANRLKQHLAPDARDYPVNPEYVQSISAQGVDVFMQSRWLNAVGVNMSASQALSVSRLPFVLEVSKPSTQAHETETNCDPLEDSNLGFLDQILQLGIPSMHSEGFTGKGVTIAVFDNGFVRSDSLPGLFHLFAEEKIVATRDFVSQATEVFDPCVHCRHGTYVLSILAARMPGYLIGAAPDASLILLRTENDSSETTREEMNWVAAAEYADSLGAQVFSTSLGYYDFDDGSDYSGKLDGKTALISLAAQIASEKGIVVVNSAGNRGTGGLSAPADAPGVIATGAIDRCGDLASFSSRGPSTDGRIKPDVVAMGKTNTYFHPDGSLRTGDGTSFSCPLVSGLAACLLQAAPQATAIQIRDAILQSGDRHANPDSEFGHGLPNAAQSLAFLNQTQSGNVDFGVVVYDYSLLAYPNPSSGSIYLAFQPSIINQTWNVAVLDLSGRTILNTEWKVPGSFGQMKLPTNLAPGRYWVIVSDPAKPNVNWRTAVEISD